MKITYCRINHVTFAVPADEHAKVREFYGKVLGLKEVKRPEALSAIYDIIWYELLDPFRNYFEFIEMKNSY